MTKKKKMFCTHLLAMPGTYLNGGSSFLWLPCRMSLKVKSCVCRPHPPRRHQDPVKDSNENLTHTDTHTHPYSPSALHAKQRGVTSRDRVNVSLVGNVSGDRLGAELQAHKIQAWGSVRRKPDVRVSHSVWET